MARKKREPGQTETLLHAMNLRTTVLAEHQNDLFARVEKLEKYDPELLVATVAKCKEKIIALENATKQSPSDRCLFARVRELEAKLARLDTPDAFGDYYLRQKAPVVATKSPREQYLERHCEWLQQELARYVRY